MFLCYTLYKNYIYYLSKITTKIYISEFIAVRENLENLEKGLFFKKSRKTWKSQGKLYRQGSDRPWKTWKTWKTWKIVNFEKKSGNPGIMFFFSRYSGKLPNTSKKESPTHRTFYNYQGGDWDSFRDYIRDMPNDVFFKWIKSGIEAFVPFRNLCGSHLLVLLLLLTEIIFSISINVMI